jgi:asparagine synthase (glutamine-hydrolysing)
MCGIAGIVALRKGLAPPPLEALQAMAGALRHRGPDEFGLYRDARAGLAHARLSILDPQGGQQPFAAAERRLWLVFNGEIFNYLELRDELSALGYRFATRSDTEVVLRAYEAWGERAFVRFNGQFAIALWDARARRLVLARDRHGIQPLHLCEHGGRLWFASEAKAIFAGAPSLPRRLDAAGLVETFTFWSVVPPQTVFEGIEELRPGYVRTVSARGSAERAFWQPRYPVTGDCGPRLPLEEAAERVRTALEQAVRLRLLHADVPVGSYLSGGIDSSLVAALASRASHARLRTFSIRFEDAQYDETLYQRAAVSLIGSEHREILVTRRDIAEALPDAVRHAERPLLRAAAVPLFLLSRLAQEAGVKVVLTGEGADEVFAGYDLFREGKVRRYWGRSPASTRRPLLLARLYPYLARSPNAQPALAREFFGRGRERWAAPGFGHQTRWQSTAALQRLFAPGFLPPAGRVDVVGRLLAHLPEEFSRWSTLAQDQYLETRTLLAGYLLAAQGDRMLMAHSVEGRFPFLDVEVVELANALPASYKLRVLDEKHVLKRAARELLPASIVRRKKQPYRAPDAAAFAGPAAPEWAEELMSARAVADAGIFDPRLVARLWAKSRANKAGGFSNADDMALTGVLSTQLVHAQFIRAAPTAMPARRFRTWVDRLAPAHKPTVLQ